MEASEGAEPHVKGTEGGEESSDRALGDKENADALGDGSEVGAIAPNTFQFASQEHGSAPSAVPVPLDAGSQRHDLVTSQETLPATQAGSTAEDNASAAEQWTDSLWGQPATTELAQDVTPASDSTATNPAKAETLLAAVSAGTPAHLESAHSPPELPTPSVSSKQKLPAISQGGSAPTVQTAEQATIFEPDNGPSHVPEADAASSSVLAELGPPARGLGHLEADLATGAMDAALFAAAASGAQTELSTSPASGGEGDAGIADVPRDLSSYEAPAGDPSFAGSAPTQLTVIRTEEATEPSSGPGDVAQTLTALASAAHERSDDGIDRPTLASPKNSVQRDLPNWTTATADAAIAPNKSIAAGLDSVAAGGFDSSPAVVVQETTALPVEDAVASNTDVAMEPISELVVPFAVGADSARATDVVSSAEQPRLSAIAESDSTKVASVVPSATEPSEAAVAGTGAMRSSETFIMPTANAVSSQVPSESVPTADTGIRISAHSDIQVLGPFTAASQTALRDSIASEQNSAAPGGSISLAAGPVQTIAADQSDPNSEPQLGTSVSMSGAQSVSFGDITGKASSGFTSSAVPRPSPSLTIFQNGSAPVFGISPFSSSSIAGGFQSAFKSGFATAPAFTSNNSPEFVPRMTIMEVGPKAEGAMDASNAGSAMQSPAMASPNAGQTSASGITENQDSAAFISSAGSAVGVCSKAFSTASEPASSAGGDIFMPLPSDVPSAVGAEPTESREEANTPMPPGILNTSSSVPDGTTRNVGNGASPAVIGFSHYGTEMSKVPGLAGSTESENALQPPAASGLTAPLGASVMSGPDAMSGAVASGPGSLEIGEGPAAGIEGTSEDPLYCKICDVKCVSLSQIEEHKKGKKHSKNVARASGLGMEQIKPASTPPNDVFVATPSGTDAATSTVIGGRDIGQVPVAEASTAVTTLMNDVMPEGSPNATGGDVAIDDVPSTSSVDQSAERVPPLQSWVASPHDTTSSASLVPSSGFKAESTGSTDTKDATGDAVSTQIIALSAGDASKASAEGSKPLASFGSDPKPVSFSTPQSFAKPRLNPSASPFTPLSTFGLVIPSVQIAGSSDPSEATSKAASALPGTAQDVIDVDADSPPSPALLTPGPSGGTTTAPASELEKVHFEKAGVNLSCVIENGDGRPRIRKMSNSYLVRVVSGGSRNGGVEFREGGASGAVWLFMKGGAENLKGLRLKKNLSSIVLTPLGNEASAYRKEEKPAKIIVPLSSTEESSAFAVAIGEVDKAVMPQARAPQEQAQASASQTPKAVSAKDEIEQRLREKRLAALRSLKKRPTALRTPTTHGADSNATSQAAQRIPSVMEASQPSGKRSFTDVGRGRDAQPDETVVKQGRTENRESASGHLRPAEVDAPTPAGGTSVQSMPGESGEISAQDGEAGSGSPKVEISSPEAHLDAPTSYGQGPRRDAQSDTMENPAETGNKRGIEALEGGSKPHAEKRVKFDIPETKGDPIGEADAADAPIGVQPMEVGVPGPAESEQHVIPASNGQQRPSVGEGSGLGATSADATVLSPPQLNEDKSMVDVESDAATVPRSVEDRNDGALMSSMLAERDEALSALQARLKDVDRARSGLERELDAERGSRMTASTALDNAKEELSSLRVTTSNELKAAVESCTSMTAAFRAWADPVAARRASLVGMECRPWSVEDFFQRLDTFEPTSWYGFAEIGKICPVECARHGWYNSGWNEITSTDGAVVRLNADALLRGGSGVGSTGQAAGSGGGCAAYGREVQRVRDSIVATGHRMLSAWIGSSCAASFGGLGPRARGRRELEEAASEMRRCAVSGVLRSGAAAARLAAGVADEATALAALNWRVERLPASGRAVLACGWCRARCELPAGAAEEGGEEEKEEGEKGREEPAHYRFCPIVTQGAWREHAAVLQGEGSGA